MNKTILIVTIALAFSLVLNGALYFFIAEKDSNIISIEQQIQTLTNNFESLTNEFNALNSTFQEYKDKHSHTNIEYDELMSSYEQLTQTYENYVANHTFTNSQHTTLQNQVTDLQSQLYELNQNYQDIQEDYDELLSEYNLITSPATVFETLDDFEIELNLNKRTYLYTEPIIGNISIHYTNGTTFQGKFVLSIFGESGAMSTGRYDVNGYGEFIVEPPTSFYYGPGEYTVHLSQILNLDGYSIIGWEELSEINVSVVAK